MFDCIEENDCADKQCGVSRDNTRDLCIQDASQQEIEELDDVDDVSLQHYVDKNIVNQITGYEA